MDGRQEGRKLRELSVENHMDASSKSKKEKENHMGAL
jgi:hypothetical protein